jgi:hypothetical protein
VVIIHHPMEVRVIAAKRYIKNIFRNQPTTVGASFWDGLAGLAMLK